MADSSCSTCLTKADDELAILCSLICVCNVKPLESKKKTQLKQLCVDKGLDWIRGSGQALNILPEVGYYMKPAIPQPLMLEGDANQQIPKNIRNFGHRFNRVKVLLKKDKIEKYKKGMLRIPDVIITKDPKLDPVQSNINKVVEIKFPGDKWGKGQKKAYQKIAGHRTKLIEMTPAHCGCDDDDKKNKKEQIRQPHPELQQAWSNKRDQQDNNIAKDVGIMIGCALLTAVLVADDVLPTGATQADDVLLPGTTTAMARAATRVISSLMKTPVKVPLLAL